jgi:hypothetical protein
VTSYFVDGEWTVDLAGATPTLSEACIVTHVAGAGEVALLQTTAMMVLASGEDYLYLAHAVATDGGDFSFANNYFNISPTGGSIASTTALARIPLTAGATYEFAAVLQSNAAVTVDLGTCQMLVTIARQ